MVSRKEYLKLFYWLHILGVIGTAIFQTWSRRGLAAAYLPIGGNSYAFPSETIQMLTRFRDYNMSLFFLVGVVGLLFLKKEEIRYVSILPILFHGVLFSLFLSNQYFLSYLGIDIFLVIILGSMLVFYKKIGNNEKRIY